MFARVIVGARDIMIIAPLATLLGTVLGTTIGLIMGYFRGLTDDVISRLVEAFLALPLVDHGADRDRWRWAAFEPDDHRRDRHRLHAADRPHGPRRGPAERELDYVAAARLRGERAPYIMFVEILPNVLAPILVEFTVRLGYAIFTVAILSFLGLRPPAAVAGLGP